MNRFLLKIIACATMLADHICFAFFSGNAAANMVRLTFGRIAFPLFAFMLVRGFLYTHSRKKYALGVLLTALASEAVYDCLFYRKIPYWGNQNILFLLLLALIMLNLADRFSSSVLLQAVIVAACGAAAHFLKLDYSFWGILVIAVFYFLKNAPFYASGAAACLVLSLGYGTIGAFLAVIPLSFYKETRGRLTPAGKYAFYLFYPLHLAVLLLIRIWM